MITKTDYFGSIPVQVSKVEIMSATDFATMADKVLNYAIDGFTFKVGDIFKILGLGRGIIDMTRFPEMTLARLARIAKSQGKELGEAPDLDKVHVPYISIQVTRNGVTDIRAVTADRLLNSEVPSTNTGYTAEIGDELDEIRGKFLKLDGMTADRLKTLGQKSWVIKYSKNPPKNVKLSPNASALTIITPHIYAYAPAE